jgi:ABC-type transport system involved in multi-copper enzyme maturation permease subunit
MLQALHIFTKDVRSLRYEIGVTLALVAAFVFFQVAEPRLNDLGIPFLLVIAGWLLTVRVVHEEPLPGTRQFWLTRPYSRASLLAAKILFLIAFIIIPKTIADLILTLNAGFSFRDVVPGVLWSQVLLFTLFVLPIAAIAAVTANLVQAIFGSLLLLLFLPLSYGYALGPLDWVQHAAMAFALAVAAPLVVALEYWSRRTTLVRSFGLALWIAVVFAGVALDGNFASAIQSRIFPVRLDGSQIGMELDSTGTATLMNGFDAQIRLPIRFTSLPVEKATSLEMLPRIIATNLQIRAFDGALWPPPESGTLTSAVTIDREPALDFNVPADYYAKLKAGPASVRATLYVTLYGNHRMFSIDHQRVIVPGIGVCSIPPLLQHEVRPGMICRTLFRSPRLLVLDRQEFNGEQPGFFYQISHSPFPAELDIQPIEVGLSMALPRNIQLPFEITTLEPLAHFQRRVNFTGLHLEQLKEEVFPLRR